MNKIARAIESDAGHALPGSREALAQAKAGDFSRVHAPEQIVARRRGRLFAVLLLSTNHLPSFIPHVGKIAEALDAAQPGSLTKVDCGTFVPRRMRKPGTPSLCEVSCHGSAPWHFWHFWKTVLPKYRLRLATNSGRVDE